MVLGLSRSKKNKAPSSIELDYLINVQEINPWPLKLGTEILLLQWENGGSNSGSLTSIFVGDDKVEFGDPFRLSVNLTRRRRTSGFHKNCLDFQLYEPKTDKAMKGQLLGSAVVNFAGYADLKESIVVNVPFSLKKSAKGAAQPVLNVNIQPFPRDDESSASTLQNEGDGTESEEIASFTDDDIDEITTSRSVPVVSDEITTSRSVPVVSSSNALENDKVPHGTNDESASDSIKDWKKTVKKEPSQEVKIPAEASKPTSVDPVNDLPGAFETNKENDSKAKKPNKNSGKEVAASKSDDGASEENDTKKENLDQDVGQKSLLKEKSVNKSQEDAIKKDANLKSKTPVSSKGQDRAAASHKLKNIMLSAASESTRSKDSSSKNLINEKDVENTSMSIQSNSNSTPSKGISSKSHSKQKEKEMNDPENTSTCNLDPTQSKWNSTKSHFVSKEKDISVPEKNTSIPVPSNFDQSKGVSSTSHSRPKEKEMNVPEDNSMSVWATPSNVNSPENTSVSVESSFGSTPSKGVSKKQLRQKEKEMNPPENASISVHSNFESIQDTGDSSKSHVNAPEDTAMSSKGVSSSKTHKKEVGVPENTSTSVKSKSTSNEISSNNGRVQKAKKIDTSKNAQTSDANSVINERDGTVYEVSGKKSKIEIPDSRETTLSSGISSHRVKKAKEIDSPKSTQNSTVTVSSPISEKEGILKEISGEKVKLEPKVKILEEDTARSSGNIHRVRKAKGTKHTPNEKDESSGEKVKLESKIEILEEELRETAAVEVGLYSIVAEHTRSTVKVHAPARRLSRFYLHAFKSRTPAKRAGSARAIVSGLVLVSKACGSDVPRLTYWLSNSIGLRAIISQAVGTLQLSAQPQSNTDEWEDPLTFLVALEKFEAWIFSRIVESVWWQALTPHMQPAPAKSSGSRKAQSKKTGLGDQDQGNFSVELWKKAFKDACERICPLRAAGHECGCLLVMAKLVMEQLVSRLDVAMFNAILRESAEEMPTDPVSDPISDSQVLPIPAGKTSFGAGAQLKNAVGNWSIWLTDLFGIDENNECPKDKIDHGDEKTVESNAFFTAFPLLKALSDLMMLPVEMLADRSSRKEVCPTFGASVVKRVFENFVPDEFSPEPIPEKVLEAIHSEDLAEAEESITSIPWAATPTVYSPPPAASLIRIIGEVTNQPLQKCSSALRKSYTSDDELDELDSPINLILADSSRVSPTSAAYNWKPKGTAAPKVVRYQLLREIWKDGE